MRFARDCHQLKGPPAKRKKKKGVRAKLEWNLIYRAADPGERFASTQAHINPAAPNALPWDNWFVSFAPIRPRDGWHGAIMSFLIYAVCSLLLSRQTRAVPSVQSLGSDLSIVQHNDLYGSSSPRAHAAILLSSPHTQKGAAAACSALGEQLWTVPSDPSKSDFFQYLSSQGAAASPASSERYWVGGRYGCNAVDKKGNVKPVACNSRLPVLCSQSAQLSAESSIDSSQRWQTSVVAGSQAITGFRDKLSFRFQGVRYAPKPDRFAHSTPYAAGSGSGSGNVSAVDFGPTCITKGCDSAGGACSEDCLFLNIWTSYLPHNPKQAKLRPVLFWIHGGAFTGGTGSDPTFDGANLASRGDVVVVTINYRLSTLGFLALDDGVTNGNYGLGDQITALDWVRANIEAFGGDPEKITIFGQSAGAASVRALLGSPKAIGKFQAAIPMSNLAGSNYATTYSKYYTIAEEVEVAANSILSGTGCANSTDQLSCLRAYDPVKLLAAGTAARFVVVDGTYITTTQLEVNGNGPAASVPVMIGLMRDDGAAMITYRQTTNLSESLIAAGLGSPSITSSGLFPQSYGVNQTLDVFNVTARVATDAMFRCLDQASAYAGVKSQVFPDTYFYEFNRSYQLSLYSPNAPTCEAPKTVASPYGDPSQEYFKCHSGELYYVFGSLLFNGLKPRDDVDIPFSQYIVDSWTSFARNFDPNPDWEFLSARGYVNTTQQLRKGGRWQKVQTEKPTLRRLQWETEQVGFQEAQQCDLLGYPLSYYLA